MGEVQVLVGGDLPTAEIVDEVMAKAKQRGFQRLVTSALEPHEAPAFAERGFTMLEELIVLSLNLDEHPHVRSPVPSNVNLKPMRRWRRDDALAVDAQAFEPFWRLDGVTLRDAEHATLRSRSRIADANGQIVGYCVTGGGAQQGYVQRLAVAPEAEGKGIGRALLEDGLDWLGGMGTSRVLVNTQQHNLRALQLYRRRGFAAEPHTLSVLECDLVEAST